MSNKSKQPRAKKQDRHPISGNFRIFLGLSIAAVAAYWNSFDVPFVFDDLVTIQKNEGVRFGDYLLNPYLLAGRGLLYVTFAANYLIHGMQVWGYHLVNLVLHVLNGFIVFFIAQHIFRRTTSDPDRIGLFAFLAAGVFLVHPVQTESVTYISSRSELLSTLFYGVACLIFIKAPDAKAGLLLSLVVAVPFLLGLMSKETVITLPAVLVLYDFLFRSDSRIRPLVSRWRFYITFILGGVGAGYFLVTRVIAGSIGAREGHLAPWSYFLTQLGVIVQYVRVVFLPIGLNVDHDVRASLGILEPKVIGALLLLLFIGALGWYYRRKEPIVSFAIFWFFITLSPTSSFVPILDVMFEHRLYLPLVAVCLLFPLLLDRCSQWIRTRWQYHLALKYWCAALLFLFAAATILRNQVWRDEARLWTDVIAKSPDKARGYSGLSFAYYKKGEFERALEAARRGLQAAPDEPVVFHETMGNVNLRLARYDEAIAAFTESANKSQDKRRQSNQYNNIGVAYLYKWQQLRAQQPQLSEGHFRSEKERILGLAAEAFIKSIELESDTFSALDSYINVMHDDGKDNQAAAVLQARFGAEDFRVFYGVAKVANWQGDLNKASEYYEKASRLRPDQKMIYFNHAYTLTSLMQTDAAIKKYIQAIRLDPLFTEANFNIGLLYGGKKNFPQALDYFQEILRMNPTHLLTHLEMAKIYIQEGNRSKAREHLSIVLTSAPDNKDAVALWQQAGS